MPMPSAKKANAMNKKPQAKPKKAAPKKAERKAKSHIIKVDALARVEGEGALTIRIKDDKITELKFRIFEPPRFFEAFLRGRDFREVPDITARICGICPMAYNMGASQALENALGVKVTGPLRDLRRMIYCGEWIESHVLHAAMLHAPDFLGLPDAIQIAATNPDLVKKALRLKKLGNSLLEVAGGGRAIHPVNLKVGGFYKAPSRDAVRALIPELEWGIEASIDLTKAFAGFDFPDYDFDYTCVSMRHPDEYAITEGDIVSNRGLEIGLDEFLDHFAEDHVAHSNALRGRMGKGSAEYGGEAYYVGPIARYNNNYSQLSALAKRTAKAAGLGTKVTNPFKSILVRMIETLYACEEALRIAKAYDKPDQSCIDVTAKKSSGVGCTEAPRGICFHAYSMDKNGLITKATIMPPTAQNQRQIERDLWGVVERNLDLDTEALTWRCEQTVRNYDPCISCATHFIKMDLIRE